MLLPRLSIQNISLYMDPKYILKLNEKISDKIEDSSSCLSKHEEESVILMKRNFSHFLSSTNECIYYIGYISIIWTIVNQI